MASPQTIYLQSGATVTVERGETLRLLKAAAPRLGYSIDNALGKYVFTRRSVCFQRNPFSCSIYGVCYCVVYLPKSSQ